MHQLFQSYWIDQGGDRWVELHLISENLPQRPFVHYKSHMYCTSIEPRIPQEEASVMWVMAWHHNFKSGYEMFQADI
jgi:hypothetical protein